VINLNNDIVKRYSCNFQLLHLTVSSYVGNQEFKENVTIRTIIYDSCCHNDL